MKTNNIETIIYECRRLIAFYDREVMRTNNFTSLSIMQKHLESEKRRLQNLKESHPEYFI